MLSTSFIFSIGSGGIPLQKCRLILLSYLFYAADYPFWPPSPFPLFLACIPSDFFSATFFFSPLSDFFLESFVFFSFSFFLFSADFFSSFLVSCSFTPSEASGAFSPVWPLDDSADGFTTLLPAGALGAVSWIPVPLAGPAPGPFAACFGASASFVGSSIPAFSSFFFLRP